MTNDELEAQCVLEKQSRAAIKAWCDDPSVSIEYRDKRTSQWLSKEHDWFSTDSYHYRIAKPTRS